MKNLLRTAAVFGVCAAAGSAQAATETLSQSFNYDTITNGTLVLTNPSDTVSFDTALGTLDSVGIAWDGVTLSMSGTTGVVGGLIGGLATGPVTVNGSSTGANLMVLGGNFVFGTGKPISFSANGNSSDQTFTSGSIFTTAAAGGPLDIAWNMAPLATLSASQLGNSSGMFFLNTTGNSADLTADLTVTFNYTSSGGPPPPPSIPESSTWTMLGLGFAALGFAGYRKNSDSARGRGLTRLRLATIAARRLGGPFNKPKAPAIRGLFFVPERGFCPARLGEGPRRRRGSRRRAKGANHAASAKREATTRSLSGTSTFAETDLSFGSCGRSRPPTSKSASCRSRSLSSCRSGMRAGCRRSAGSRIGCSTPWFRMSRRARGRRPPRGLDRSAIR